MINRLTRRHTDRLIFVALAGYLVFGLACVSDDNNDSKNTNNTTGTNNTTSTRFEGGTVDADLTLDGEYTMRESVRVQNNATLTIKPGTIIRMCADCEFVIGAFGSAATIKADGTAEKPIQFLGITAEPGFWEAVRLEKNTTTNSSLTHLSISHAGSQEAALRLDNSISLSHVTIADSAKSGLFLNAALKAGASMLTIKGCGEYPVIVEATEGLTTLPTDGSYAEGHGKPMIRVATGAFRDTLTVHNPGIPYLLTEGMLVQDDDTEVTVEAGVRFVVSQDREVVAGAFGTGAALKLMGTAEAPITFEGADTAPGSWRGLWFQRKARANASTAEHVHVMHGGTDSEGCVQTETPVTLKHVKAEACKGFGFDISEEGLGDGSMGLVATGVKGYAANVRTEALTTLPTVESSFTGNDNDMIRTHGGVIKTTGVVPNPGVPLFMTDGLLVQDDGVEVTLAAGLELRFSNNKELVVGAFGTSSKLIAEGTAAAPILMRGFDDTPGSWSGVRVDRNSQQSTTLRHVHLKHGGDSTGANLTLLRAITVDQCTLEASQGYGLHVNYGDADGIDYATPNTFTNNAAGDINDDRNG